MGTLEEELRLISQRSTMAPAATVLQTFGTLLFELRLVSLWNRRGNCLLVVGATNPAELVDVRQTVGSMHLLIAGVGAQGGNLAEAVTRGQTADGTGLIISVSRSILYASNGEDFAQRARLEAEKLCAAINVHRHPGLTP